RISQAGLPNAEEHLRDRSLTLVSELLRDPDFDQILVGGEAALNSLGGAAGLLERITASQLATYQLGVNSATIVFAHSALDAAVSELCWIVAFSSQEAWERYLDRKQITLGDLRQRGRDAVVTEKLARYLSSLEREPLLLRCDRLLEVCRPSPVFPGIRGFCFDRNRLSTLDLLRHDIVHHNVDASRLERVDDDLEFLLQSGLYLWSLVNHRYDVRIDARFLSEAQAGSLDSNQS
ncbi:MAG TPA: hypothetical protein VEY33_07595, partial [Gemmatimonadota bacterium]|nr:hypothetical protein [Gemmatimonadota bacterium]